VRIGCALQMPQGPTRAGLVALHGYGDVPTLAHSAAGWEPLVDRGVAVLTVRVRGYPGSRLDAAHLAGASDRAGGGRWITVGLDRPVTENGCGTEWSFSYAVADAVNAVRALRAELDRPAQSGGHGTPIYLHGESFGGALAVIAASILADRDEIARLAIGVPGMGDWAWRLSEPDRCGLGSGTLIRQRLDATRDRADLCHVLRAFDAAIHARRVRCPVLCKLAFRDEVVPAPAAAAVFNALGADPGQKWRHTTRYGHFDGGLSDLRRHADFQRKVMAFLDPGSEPAEGLASLDA
jgi:cephalosporin-C deacetylase-like acetyl esterase